MIGGQIARMDMMKPNTHSETEQRIGTVIDWLEKLTLFEQRVKKRLLKQCEPAVYHSLKRELAQIQDALKRHKLGSFGQCVICSASINTSRLEFIPYAELCFSCQRSKEREAGAQNRHVAE